MSGFQRCFQPAREIATCAAQRHASLPAKKHINLCRFITINASYVRICAHDAGTRMEIYARFRFLKHSSLIKN